MGDAFTVQRLTTIVYPDQIVDSDRDGFVSMAAFIHCGSIRSPFSFLKFLLFPPPSLPPSLVNTALLVEVGKVQIALALGFELWR